MYAEFELEALLVTGSCTDVAPVRREDVHPRGVQLALGPPGGPPLVDTLVMSNLGARVCEMPLSMSLICAREMPLSTPLSLSLCSLVNACHQTTKWLPECTTHDDTSSLLIVQ